MNISGFASAVLITEHLAALAVAWADDESPRTFGARNVRTNGMLALQPWLVGANWYPFRCHQRTGDVSGNDIQPLR